MAISFRLGFLLPALLLGLGSCAFHAPISAGSVYWWRTTLDWSGQDTLLLKHEGITTIDLRLFDWDNVNGHSVEAGPLLIVHKIPQDFEVVPVVYVTVAQLEAWARLGDAPRNAGVQARLLLGRLQAWAPRAWTRSAPWVQIDADWARSDRKAYFAVLAALQRLLHAQKKKLSVTLRLHQYKERGVLPPADAVTLLTYGAADPQNPNSQTVLDPAMVADYVRGTAAPYPLPMQVALPEYALVRQFNPFDRLVAMARVAPDAARFPPGLGFLRPGWRVSPGTLRWNGLLLMPNDRLNLQSPAPAEWTAALNTLRKAGWGGFGQKADVILFDYDRQEWGSANHEAFWKALHS